MREMLKIFICVLLASTKAARQTIPLVKLKKDLSVNNSHQGERLNPTQEDALKSKLYDLIEETKSYFGNKMANVEKIHDSFKHKSLYEVGYIISHMKQKYNDLQDQYQYIDVNKGVWGALKILNAYQSVKKLNDYLSKLLVFLYKEMDGKFRIVNKPVENILQKMTKSHQQSPISWSYYDDTI